MTILNTYQARMYDWAWVTYEAPTPEEAAEMSARDYADDDYPDGYSLTIEIKDHGKYLVQEFVEKTYSYKTTKVEGE